MLVPPIFLLLLFIIIFFLWLKADTLPEDLEENPEKQANEQDTQENQEGN